MSQQFSTRDSPVTELLKQAPTGDQTTRAADHGVTRHIDIQHFAVQDWKESGTIVMKFISGVINPSDDLMKPLGWALHDRHACRIMRHC